MKKHSLFALQRGIIFTFVNNAVEWLQSKHPERRKEKIRSLERLGLCRDVFPGAEGSSAPEAALCLCAFLCSSAGQWAQHRDMGRGCGSVSDLPSGKLNVVAFTLSWHVYCLTWPVRTAGMLSPHSQKDEGNCRLLTPLHDHGLRHF